MEADIHYTLGKIISHGTFSVVYQGTDSTDQKVAIKRVYQDTKFKNRELELIKYLNHYD